MPEKNNDISQLPKDWKWVKLGDVCKLKNGFAFKSNEYKSEGIPVIRISDIKQGIVNPGNSVRVNEQEVFDDYIVKTDEILVAMSGATTGKFGIYKSIEKAYQNQRVGKFGILNEERLDNNFLLYQLHALKRQIEKDAYGGAQPNISSGKIEAMQIVLPPKPMQLTIVSKIEELFSELDKGIESLLTAKQQLKTYRQSVLKSAFEGKLTNGLNNDALDLHEVHDLIIAAEKGVEYRTIKNQKNQKNHLMQDLGKGELPKGWEMKTIGDVFEVFIGSTPKRNKPEYWGGNINWLSSGEIAFCNIAKTKETITVKGLDNTSCKIHPIGTVIIAMIGEGKTRGQAAILKIEASHNQNTAAIRVDKNIYITELLYYYLVLKYEDNRRIGSGNNQKALNKERIKNIFIPLPPIIEQQLIVQAIESRISIADKMEADITQILQQVEALRQSILKKAFGGKLI